MVAIPSEFCAEANRRFHYLPDVIRVGVSLQRFSSFFFIFTQLEVKLCYSYTSG